MKKILSVMLIFMASLTLIGATQDVAAAEGDATVYFHIHQFDGDYTNTGIGIWDGVDWNGWGDTVTLDDNDDVVTDDFGAVVEFVIPAAKLTNASLMDDIQLEITRSADSTNDSTSQAGYLAPGNGKVFADITSLKSGDATELHVYYVEGAHDTYIPTDGMGMAFITYIDPKVAGDETAYDAWNIWTFNNGTGGSAAGPGADEGFEFTMDMTVTQTFEDTEYEMAMKLAVIEVAADADAAKKTGFIVRTNDWAKQCSTDILIDNSSFKGDGAIVRYYQAGSCELETDGPAYLLDVVEQYDYFAGNKFVSGTIIADPMTVEVNFSMFKNPSLLDLSRFGLKDGDGNVVPIESIDYATLAKVGTYTSTAVCTDTQYLFQLHVETSLPHDQLGLVGSLNGWAIDSTIASVGDDSNGNAVFEVCVDSAAGEFKLMYDHNDDGTFDWDDGTVDITDQNQAFDLDNDAMHGIYYISVEDTVYEKITQTVDLTPVIQNYVKVYVDTTLSHEDLYIYGSFNNWGGDGELLYTEDSTEGYAVFEFVTAADSVSFKVLHDTPQDGTYGWGGNQITTSDVAINISAGVNHEVLINSDGTYTQVAAQGAVAPVNTGYFDYTSATTCNAGESLLTLFVDYSGDSSTLGLVGELLVTWNIDSPIFKVGDTTDGLAVFEVCLAENATGEFKLFEDPATNGWNNGTTGGNLAYDLTGGDQALFVNLSNTYFTLGTITETLEPTETIKRLVRVYVETDKDHSKLGIVGDFNNWDIGNALAVNTTDTNGLAYFEFVAVTNQVEFVVVFAEDGGFEWEDGDTEKLTPENQKFEIGAENEINLVVRGESATEFYYEDGFYYSELMDLSVNTLTLTFDSANALAWGTDYVLTYNEEIDDTEPLDIEIELEFNTTNTFEEANSVQELGTYAVLPGLIQVSFENSSDVTGLTLKDADGNVVAYEPLVNAYEIGTYETDSYCNAGEPLIFVHIRLNDTEVDDLAELGIVGTVNGWDIENAITASGMDDAGNYVFEICLDRDSATTGEFKIKHDKDLDGFTWDSGADPELTPGNVAFDLANGNSFYVEEGESALDTSATLNMALLEANELDKTKEYHLEFTDGNGFLVFIPIEMDTEAPVVTATRKPDVEFEFDNAGTFDVMDYFTILGFIDNREGEMDYTVTAALDPATVGEQTITISATDAWGNTGTHDIVITVVDTTPPTITGDETLTLDTADELPNWEDYVTVDGGTLTIDDSQVDMDSNGTFYIIYNAVDASGNTARHTLAVTVEGVEDIVPTTGCFSSVNIAGSIVSIMAVLGGAVLFFIRKR